MRTRAAVASVIPVPVELVRERPAGEELHPAYSQATGADGGKQLDVLVAVIIGRGFPAGRAALPDRVLRVSRRRLRARGRGEGEILDRLQGIGWTVGTLR